MEPRIETIGEKKLVGRRMAMSLSDNKTQELWHGFMSRRKEITNSLGTDLYSLRVYNDGYFKHFNPSAEFDKWAAIEVTDYNHVPPEMKTLTVPGGLYAVFFYKGAASAGGPTYQYIYGTWIPESGYELDNRPHFDLLGTKYKNEDPDSEEELWIPIKTK